MSSAFEVQLQWVSKMGNAEKYQRKERISIREMKIEVEKMDGKSSENIGRERGGGGGEGRGGRGGGPGLTSRCTMPFAWRNESASNNWRII